MKKCLSLCLAVILALAVFSGCTSSPAPATSPTTATSAGAGTPTEAKAPERPLARLLLGTSSVGGTYYVWGAGWSKIMNEKVDNVDCSVEVTGGPNTNMQLIQQDEMELGFVTTWLGGEGWSGTGWTEGKKYDKMRGMFATYYSVMYIYSLKDSGIESVYDFEGKNIAVGSPGATSDLAGRALLEILGIKVKSVTSLPTDGQLSALKDGTIDACFSITGIPGPFMLELETTHDVQHIGLSDADFDKILAAQPYWSRNVIPANTFKNQPEDVPVCAFWNMMVGHKDLDDDLVYDLVKTTFEQNEALIAVDPTAAMTVPEAVTNCVIPLHPGALRYYEEIGVTVPDSLK